MVASASRDWIGGLLVLEEHEVRVCAILGTQEQALDDARLSALTEEFDISLAAVSKHVKVLERAGLVSREILGRDHVIRARVEELRVAGGWIARQTAFWERAMARLKADLERP